MHSDGAQCFTYTDYVINDVVCENSNGMAI